MSISAGVWIVKNSKTHKLMFYGTRSEADNYKNEMQSMVTDRLIVRLLKVGCSIYLKGEEIEP